MKIGVGIVSWNRPQYFKELIKTLETNNLSDLEFHLFQDGSICRFTGQVVTDAKLITQCIQIYDSSKLPAKHFHIQEKNVSVAINQFETMEFLSKNYEYFIFLEDDIIVSPNFFVLMKRLLEQFKDNKNIACISPGFRLYCKPDRIKENLDKLTLIQGHFWAEAFWSDRWLRVKERYLTYYNLVDKQPYPKRPHQTIKELFARTGFKASTTSQDQGKDWAIKMAGLQRVRMVVNRATGIGDYGIHSTPEKLKKTCDGHNKIYVFPEELNIKEFKIR